MSNIITESSSSQIPASTPTSIFAPFRYSMFTAIWVAALASDMGLWMQNVGAGWMVTKFSESPLFVSLMVTATSLPMFLLGIPAGAFADIFNKRKILIGTQFWMFGIAGVLTFVTFTGATSPVLFLWLSFL